MNAATRLENNIDKILTLLTFGRWCPRRQTNFFIHPRMPASRVFIFGVIRRSQKLLCKHLRKFLYPRNKNWPRFHVDNTQRHIRDSNSSPSHFCPTYPRLTSVPLNSGQTESNLTVPIVENFYFHSPTNGFDFGANGVKPSKIFSPSQFKNGTKTVPGHTFNTFATRTANLNLPLSLSLSLSFSLSLFL